MKVVLLTFALLSLCYAGTHFVSNALGSNMVLQRAPQKARIWGWSKTPTSTITVHFKNRAHHTTADSAGRWSFDLPATSAGGPYDIRVSSSAGESQTLSNVLFGDVWVCGGQSNMQFTVDEGFNATEEVRAAAGYPNIRVFTVGQGAISETPLDEFSSIFQPWTAASPESIGTGNWSAFSAACWFFGKNIYDRYKIPVGLFSDNWGGTYIQTWMSPGALEKCSDDVPVDFELPHVTRGLDPNKPSLLWNAMITPILPMTIKGVTWYQGESNSNQPNYYACAFPVMIKDWREKWGIHDLGFFYVQLAPWIWDNLTAQAVTRLSQLFANSLPKVGVATAMDLGDPTSPFGSIHPRDKQSVGRRLSDAARALTYGEKIPYKGPMAVSWKILSLGPSAVVEVTFEGDSVDSGLLVKKFSCPAGVPGNECAEYEIGTSGGWIKAVGSIHGSKVRISATVPADSEISGVRYGFANFPIASLWNGDGFPAIPFAFPNPVKPQFA